MSHDEIIATHNLVRREDDSSYARAANYALALMGAPENVKTKAEAVAVLSLIFFSFLNHDRYEEAALLAWGNKIFNPKPRSVQLIWRTIGNHRKILAMGAGAQGKCLAKGTKVLMFDGGIKNVEDVKTGDSLMGDDSTPRRVLSTTVGHGAMFEIVPKRGAAWKCNDAHILTLCCNRDRKNGDGKTVSSNFRRGGIKDIPISEFHKASKSFRSHYKQFTVPINFPTKEVEFDSYIYGMWLGDGGVGHPVLHNTDKALIKTWCDYFVSKGYRIAINATADRSCAGYFARLTNFKYVNGVRPEHRFKNFVRRSYIDGEKRILPEYLRNSSEVRMKLLAGIIDTDGYRDFSGFGVMTKYKGLAEDIAYLARSLGFSCQFYSRKKQIKSIGFEGNYYSIHIGGPVNSIPTILKKADEPKLKNRNHRLTSIDVFPCGDDNYYGFTLDGNGRFLLGDFTVTHNTYSASVRYFLRWVRDPKYTLIKLISTTGGHARSNIYSTFVRLHKESIIPMPGIVRQDYIGLSTDDMHSAISRIAISPGESGESALRGFHPLPRPDEHPVFGAMSWSIAILDEAEGIPPAVWKGVDNIASTGNVEVYAATNPVNITSEFAIRAEPVVGGWGNWDRENAEEWEGHEHWHVVRLDAAKSENVIYRKEVYSGFMLYEGYCDYESKGTYSPDFDTFARGRYPMVTIQYHIVPSYFLNGVKSTFHFIGQTDNVASLDPAFEEGGDDPTLTTGRYGLASGWYDEQGKFIRLQTEKYCLQVEQQFVLSRRDTADMTEDVITICQDLHVRPEWFVMDCTGNGTGVRDLLKRQFGEILPVMWGASATNRKIVSEDTQAAEELYPNIASELWFAFSRWLEFGFIKFSPTLDTKALFHELTSRKYSRLGKIMRRAEAKKDFKSRNSGKSCDRADSLIMLVHICRMRGEGIASMLPAVQERKENKSMWEDLRKSVIEPHEPSPDWVSV
jgi:Hom_end-associated Hint/Homing endonuclease